MKPITQHHIKIHGKRTTITLLRILEELLLIKLQLIPDETEESEDLKSKKVLRLWLQGKADHFDEQSGEKLSQWIQKEVILYLTSDETVEAWRYWKYGPIKTRPPLKV